MTARAWILITLPLLLAGPAHADLGEELRRCGAIEAPAERLACYDGLAGRAPEPPEESFGRPAPDLRREAPSEIRSTLVGLSRDPYGYALLRLANGQLWKLEELDHMRPRGSEIPVTIERTTLGGYHLNVGGYSAKYRATRLE